jgi:dephospho-CoA kinase
MSTDPTIVIGVAGRIGSGKSTIAHLLERELGFQYFRYSLELASWFDVDPDDKTRLQEVGAEVMAGEGQQQLNLRLIRHIGSGRNAAVDGLRHPIDFDSLQNAFGKRFFLLFVETDSRTRFERMQLKKRFETYDEFLAADTRPTELNIDRLLPFAAETVSGAQTEADLLYKLHSLIDEFRQRIDT